MNSVVYKGERKAVRASVSQLSQSPYQLLNMQFFVLATLIAVAAANSAYQSGSAYSSSSYNSPSYSGSTYETYAPQPYAFNWAVNDGYGSEYSNTESNDGKVTTGTYRVALPDGRIQIVTYKADDYGYKADVKYEGQVKYAAASYTSPAYSAPAYSAPVSTAYTSPVVTAPARYAAPSTSKGPVYRTSANVARNY